MLLLAQVLPFGVAHLAIVIVVIAAVVGLVAVALQQFHVSIPPWIVQIFWILVVACAVILAIKFIAAV